MKVNTQLAFVIACYISMLTPMWFVYKDTRPLNISIFPFITIEKNILALFKIW